MQAVCLPVRLRALPNSKGKHAQYDYNDCCYMKYVGTWNMFMDSEMHEQLPDIGKNYVKI